MEESPLNAGEFRDKIDEQRKIKFKITRCPKVIYDKFKDFALREAGDLYPAALLKLIDTYEMHTQMFTFINQLEDIKQYIAHLEGEIDTLKVIVHKQAVNTAEQEERKFKGFGEQTQEE